MLLVASTILAGLLGCTMYMFPWLLDDMKQLSTIIPAEFKALMQAYRYKLFINLFEQRAVDFRHRPLVIFNDEVYTFGDMNRNMNKVANAALDMGFNSGDCVALMMYNSPDFLWITYGLYKIGVKVALVNTSVRQKSLVHCVRESGAKLLICGSDKELQEAIHDVSDQLTDVALWVNGLSRDIAVPDGLKCFGDIFVKADGHSFDKSVRAVEHCTMHGTVGYIYTSGTTGLVKAVRVTNYRLFGAASVPRFSRNLGENDVIYAPIPLYHSLAFMMAFGTAVASGSAFLTRKTFSASAFWDDCHKHNVTTVAYVGEMFRYLMAQPVNQEIEQTHRVRMAFGNGLRRDIWRKVRDRFCIPRIQEFFAATEGNIGFANTDNTEGAVGRLSPLLSSVLHGYLIKYDRDTDEPFRDKNGHCVCVKTGEPGLLVTKVTKFTPYSGYHGNNKKALNNKKLLHNVFKDDENVFVNFGDLLFCDDRYNLYFADRVGDTFRWKAENVSTMEVANTLCSLSWIDDVAVYGVQIPGHDGRAGMAAIQTKLDDELSDAQREELFSHCTTMLPSYARPLFVRLLKDIEVTGTYKHKKVKLVSDGFDPRLISDNLYFYNGAAKSYVVLTNDMFTSVMNGSLRI